VAEQNEGPAGTTEVRLATNFREGVPIMATEEVKAPDNQSVVGHVHPDQVAEVEAAAAAATGTQTDPAATTTAATFSSLDPVAVAVEAAAASAAPATPAAPTESTGEKIATGIEIGLVDVNAVAKVISQNFAGTPIATIAALLGPLAGLGAAVLAQHLAHKGFDLSTLKDAEIL
jgi:hypothetical protein